MKAQYKYKCSIGYNCSYTHQLIKYFLKQKFNKNGKI